MERERQLPYCRTSFQNISKGNMSCFYVAPFFDLKSYIRFTVLGWDCANFSVDLSAALRSGTLLHATFVFRIACSCRQTTWTPYLWERSDSLTQIIQFEKICLNVNWKGAFLFFLRPREWCSSIIEPPSYACQFIHFGCQMLQPKRVELRSTPWNEFTCLTTHQHGDP